jgi:L-malate glycosyltransferase
MRVGIVAPNYYPEVSGNAVTVRRIERHLRQLGCEVQVFPAEQFAAEKLLEEVRRFQPQLLHAFHGYLGGRTAHALCDALGVPYVLTLTGTDVYLALTDQRSHDTHLALRGAARLVAFHSSIKKRLAEHLPSLDERTVVIQQGVEVPADAPVGEDAAVRDTFNFLLPAGIRPVKNNIFPLQPLSALHAVHEEIRLKLVGPVLDAGYAADVMAAMEQSAFASYLGTVPHEAMRTLYREADVVINCSHSEGGMANSVLEALSYGKAVLASDIEGNRSVIKEGTTGLLFRDAAEFQAKAEQLLTDPQLRHRLGKSGMALVREKHSPDKEAAAYLELYREILQQ